LTVAYAIVQEHAGRIRLDSRLGRGASFFVELPVGGASQFPDVTASRAAQSAEEPAHGGAILIVEDEAALAAAVADALQDAGYTVTHAADGEDALALIKRQPFDLVICDLKMPRLDGQAFYASLVQAVPALSSRVIFVTGDVAGTQAERFLEGSGCRWLEKPFRLADLLKAVREGLSGS
jgi:two-component system NtrC family sensor kinase